MNKNIVFKIIMALVLVGALVGLGWFAYNAGIAQGLAVQAQTTAGAASPAAPYAYWHYPMPYMGFPFFGFLACLIPLFLLFLFFFALRGLFWRGPRHWESWHRGPWTDNEDWEKRGWYKGARSVFDEWHSQAHSGSDQQNPES